MVAQQPLHKVFARLIEALGPISLAQYMGEANARYYAHKDPLGVSGDFITAPEISQMFGELIGLWLADMWIRAGRPEPVHYCEAGPGRGTLARDALRSAAKAGLVPQVHFIETSPLLRAAQRDLVQEATWHDDFSTLPDDGALLIVANEFFDALPIRQLVKTAQGWRERMVGMAEGRFVPVAGQMPMDAAIPDAMRDQAEGTIIETSPASVAVAGELAQRLVKQGGAALFIDYGYTGQGTGSTLQAVKAHQFHDPFTDPGEADLSAHVDFSALAQSSVRHGCRHLGTVTQGEWLTALGIGTRANALIRANPVKADEVRAAQRRLVSGEGMGTLFKVMGLVAPGWLDGAGFG